MDKIFHLLAFAHHGGCEKNCYTFIREASHLHHVVYVLDTRSSISSDFEKAGIEIHHLDILSDRNLWRFAQTLKIAYANTGIKKVIYWSTIHLPLVRWAVNGKETVLDVHIGNPVERSWKSRVKNYLIEKLLPSAVDTHLFACSGYVKNSIYHDPYLSAFENSAVFNPVQIPSANPHHAKELKEPDQIKLGMVARLDRIKDHLTLLRAFKIILKTFPAIQLSLLGDGELREELIKAAMDLSVEKSVSFHGNVHNVGSYLKKWDVFLYSTTPREGLGNAVLEAMAYGLPCVLSDLPMMREIVGDSPCAFFFKAGDEEAMARQVIALLHDKERRSFLSDHAYRRIRDNMSAKKYVEARLKSLNRFE